LLWLNGLRLSLHAELKININLKIKMVMSAFAKWLCFLLLAVLVLGYWYLALLAIGLVAFFLVLWLKPEWLDYIPE